MTDTVPEVVQRIARRYAEKYPNDIDKAVDMAVVATQKIKSYPKLVDGLVRSALRSYIHDVRHSNNESIRQGAMPKVISGDSPALERVMMGAYLYSIGGRSLGDIRGEELLDIAEAEEKRAHGHNFNARLCRRLAAIVAETATVQESIPENKLTKIFREVQKH